MGPQELEKPELPGVPLITIPQPTKPYIGHLLPGTGMVVTALEALGLRSLPWQQHKVIHKVFLVIYF